MSTFIIALFLSIGTGTWLYTKFARTSGGGNTKSALIGAGVTTLILFIIIFFTLSVFLKK